MSAGDTFPPRENSALTLQRRQAYLQKLQESLAAIANEPGVVDHTITCGRCGATERPHWTYIGQRKRGEHPAMPIGWDWSRTETIYTCDSCMGALMVLTQEIMIAYLRTPHGRAHLERDLAMDD